ncbi:hypothetical protein COSO111634_20860 [Corallococcus soli]
MGSPSGVAVPWASTYPMSRGATPERFSACVMTAACPCTLGAVKPDLLRPSLLTAVARMTAWMASPSRTASSSRFSTTAATPLPETVPWPFASKARQ